jgi:osmoprotectant transport system substrate-binding protein
MQQTSRRALLAAAAFSVGAGSTVSWPGRARAAAPIRVGSKLDAEAALLGTIILSLLNAGGIPTVNRLRLGTTKILRSAILAGEVDIYPEYTGNGAFFFNLDTDPVWKDAQAGYEKIKQLDAAANKIVWLPPAPANNTWGIALRGDVAKKNSLATLEAFAQ